MQFVFKANSWQHFQREVSSLAAQLNDKPHIITVVTEDVEEIARINPEAQADVDSLIVEVTDSPESKGGPK